MTMRVCGGLFRLYRRRIFPMRGANQAQENHPTGDRNAAACNREGLKTASRTGF